VGSRRDDLTRCFDILRCVEKDLHDGAVTMATAVAWAEHGRAAWGCGAPYAMLRIATALRGGERSSGALSLWCDLIEAAGSRSSRRAAAMLAAVRALLAAPYPAEAVHRLTHLCNDARPLGRATRLAAWNCAAQAVAIAVDLRASFDTNAIVDPLLLAATRRHRVTRSEAMHLLAAAVRRMVPCPTVAALVAAACVREASP
jgi:hypothetical protein